MKNSSWNNLRAKLHHDWLQSRYLTFLKSWKECFDDVERCHPDREDVLEQLLQWRSKRDGFITLINSAEEALSPKQLLYEPPFDRMSEENKEWLGEVIHALYCSRTGIRDKIAILNSMIAEIDKIVDEVSHMLKIGKSDGQANGERIISVFVDFSRKINELPHEIQVI